ncbi:MAG TPA: hypothetical protein VGJ36_00915 [Gemmatimonadales bacterium]|jgi:hypothetical protein
MRRFVLAAATLVLTLTLSCRRQQSSQTGGVSDTATTPAPAPEPIDTASTARDFSFEQRQEFARSIRQELAGIDRQISELAAQAKSRGGAVSDRAIANIRVSRRAVDRNLARVTAATAANWEQIKNGVNQSVEKLNDSIEGAQPK